MSTQPQYGKGSKPRPFSVKLEEFADNWAMAFRKKKSVKKTQPQKTSPEPCAH